MYLLDTNHCSCLIDRHPLIVQKLQELRDTPVATCAIVRGELIYMVEHSARKSENQTKVMAFLNDIEVYPVDDSVADLYGKIKHSVFERYAPSVRKQARRIDLADMGLTDNDLWIAAVAVNKGYIVVSSDGGFLRVCEAYGAPRVEKWA